MSFLRNHNEKPLIASMYEKKRKFLFYWVHANTGMKWCFNGFKRKLHNKAVLYHSGLVLAFIMLLHSCNGGTICYRFTSFSSSKWDVGNVVEFQVPITEETLQCDIYLIVKTNPEYSYQNLYITYYIEDEGRVLCTKALENCDLYDIKTGKPSKEHELIMISRYKFAKPGLYTIKLEQFMRTNTLNGLNGVGIRVVKSI